MFGPQAPRWIGEAEITRRLKPLCLIDAVEAGFLAVADGAIKEAPATGLWATEFAAHYVAYPAYTGAEDLATVKVLTAADNNPAAGQPRIDALVIAAKASTGEIQAVFDGKSITALRTAAASAVAVRRFAPPEASILGILGTGPQAIAHARMIAAVRPITQVLVASVSGNRARAESVAADIAEALACSAKAVEVDALHETDILACCSSSTTPLIHRTKLKFEAMLVSVGPFLPTGAEFDPEIARNANRLISDDAGRLKQQWKSAALVDHAEDLATALKAPAHGSTSGAVFVSDGRAFEDLVAVKQLLVSSNDPYEGDVQLRHPHEHFER